MKRFVEGEDRRQGALRPHCLDDYVRENNPVRVIEAFIDELDLATLGFDGVVPETTGRPAYHPATLLKIYLYGYLNQVQASRRLDREAQRNIELMWLTGRLAPDFKTIADFRKDNGAAIRAVCGQFVQLCRRLKLFTHAVVAIDGSKFKAVNNRDKNYTVAKVTGRMEQVDASIARYLRALDQADREESDIAEAKSGRLKEKIAALRRQRPAEGGLSEISWGVGHDGSKGARPCRHAKNPVFLMPFSTSCWPAPTPRRLSIRMGCSTIGEKPSP